MLWLSFALAAIAFALSNSVRGEIERVSTGVDSLRSYFLAVGGVQRAMVEILWTATRPNERVIPKGSTVVQYAFPSGVTTVEFLPEAGKLDVNTLPVQDLNRLMLALGIEPAKAQEIAEAIDDWRRPLENSAAFDGYYLSLTPSFRAPHASLQEIEELLLVKGVTPEIFYGTYVPNEGPGPRLTPRGGLMDCLSVYGSRDRVDANTATSAVLTTVGLNPYAIGALLERRRLKPFTQEELDRFMESIGAPSTHLRVEGNSMLTFRATARLRLPNGELSDLKRTVAALVKYMQPGADSAAEIIRWYDTAWSN